MPLAESQDQTVSLCLSYLGANWEKEPDEFRYCLSQAPHLFLQSICPGFMAGDLFLVFGSNRKKRIFICRPSMVSNYVQKHFVFSCQYLVPFDAGEYSRGIPQKLELNFYSFEVLCIRRRVYCYPVTDLVSPSERMSNPIILCTT